MTDQPHRVPRQGPRPLEVLEVEGGQLPQVKKNDLRPLLLVDRRPLLVNADLVVVMEANQESSVRYMRLHTITYTCFISAALPTTHTMFSL